MCNPCCGVSLKIGVPLMVMLDIVIAAAYTFYDLWNLVDVMNHLLHKTDNQHWALAVRMAQSANLQYARDQLYPLISKIDTSLTSDTTNETFKNCDILYSVLLSLAILGHIFIIPVSLAFIQSLKKPDLKLFKILWIVWWLFINATFLILFIIFVIFTRRDIPYIGNDIAWTFNWYWIFYKIYELFVVYTLYRGLEISTKRLSMAQGQVQGQGQAINGPSIEGGPQGDKAPSQAPTAGDQPQAEP